MLFAALALAASQARAQGYPNKPVRAEIDTYGRVVRAAGITPQ